MFYVLALLIVLAAAATIVAPTTRLVLLAVMAGDVLVGILLMVAGAYLLGIVAVVGPALCLAAVTALLRRSGYRPLLADLPGFATGWQAAAAVSAAVGLLLLWTAAARVPDAIGSGSGPNLLTLLHYRTPVSLGVAIALVVVAIGGALLIGRTGADERALDRAAEQRRLREQRGESRRQNRAAARSRRDRGRRGSDA